jgi:hypothetical protein
MHFQYATDEFYTASSGEGGSGLPSSRRRGMGTSSTLVATTPWVKDTPTTYAMTTVSLALMCSLHEYRKIDQNRTGGR